MSRSRTISFRNAGLIDLEAISTFGVNAKVTHNPIGYFGTGLKYAIAVLLRFGHDVVLYRGQEPFVFTTEPLALRGKAFNLIYMNKQPLGFTTELGKNWELWQAFREIYCNTFDEFDPLVADDTLAPIAGHTTFHISGYGFGQAYDKRHEVVLQSCALYKSRGVEIHPGPAPYIYYRGVRVGQWEREAMFCYNIVGHDLGLTEDRTLSNIYEALRYIVKAIEESPDVDLIVSCATAPLGSLECGLSISAYAGIKANPTFLEAMSRLDPAEVTNHSYLKLYTQWAGLGLTTKRMSLNNIQEVQLKTAKELLELLGYDSERYPIIVTRELPEGILGKASQEDKTIYISLVCFEKGTKEVAGCLLEEYLHLYTGYEDESRQLQTKLFDLVVTLAEQVRGQPF